MEPFHKVWIDQCDAARGIKERFGDRKALGYLIGEKLVMFSRQVLRKKHILNAL
jgi:hypothetical protein